MTRELFYLKMVQSRTNLFLNNLSVYSSMCLLKLDNYKVTKSTNVNLE